jgi:hypothetical protein
MSGFLSILPQILDLFLDLGRVESSIVVFAIHYTYAVGIRDNVHFPWRKRDAEGETVLQ